MYVYTCALQIGLHTNGHVMTCTRVLAEADSQRHQNTPLTVHSLISPSMHHALACNIHCFAQHGRSHVLKHMYTMYRFCLFALSCVCT